MLDAFTWGANYDIKMELENDALPWALREAMESRWGKPDADPFLGDDGFALSILRFGNVVVGTTGESPTVDS